MSVNRTHWHSAVDQSVHFVGNRAANQSALPVPATACNTRPPVLSESSTVVRHLLLLPLTAGAGLLALHMSDAETDCPSHSRRCPDSDSGSVSTTHVSHWQAVHRLRKTNRSMAVVTPAERCTYSLCSGSLAVCGRVEHVQFPSYIFRLLVFLVLGCIYQ